MSSANGSKPARPGQARPRPGRAPISTDERFSRCAGPGRRRRRGRRPVGAQPPPGDRRDHRRVVGAQRDGRSTTRSPRARPRRPGGRAARSSQPRPPPITTVEIPVCSATRRSLVTSTSTTAAWNEAATSATSRSGCLRTYCTTAVFSPENEKSLPSSSIGRGNAIGSGVAGHGEPVDRGAAGIAETEEPRDLVEGLARCVVDGLAEHAVAAVVVHHDRQGVPARDDERHERRLERRVLEQRRVHVRLVMVHAHVGHPVASAIGLRRHSRPRAARPRDRGRARPRPRRGRRGRRPPRPAPARSRR